MKKALIALVMAGMAFGMAACSDDDNPLTCNTPAVYTQIKNMKAAYDGGADCEAKGEALVNYIDTNKDALDDAFTNWSDDKQAKGVCYIRDAGLYLIVYQNVSAMNTGLKKCSEDGSEKAGSALSKLGTVSFWDTMLQTAATEAESTTN